LPNLSFFGLRANDLKTVQSNCSIIATHFAILLCTKTTCGIAAAVQVPIGGTAGNIKMTQQN
jgi:hypothetical protein